MTTITLIGAGSAEFAWLTTDGERTEDELGLAADDFDVIYAYPWPDEERVTAELFRRYAAPGAVPFQVEGSMLIGYGRIAVRCPRQYTENVS